MDYQSIKDCTLERLIAFIVEINRITDLQFFIYKTRKKGRVTTLHDQDIFTYRENELRGLFDVSVVGESLYAFWLSDYFYQHKKEEENIGLISKVNLWNKDIRHIPMIDFRCLCSDEDLQEAIETLSMVGQKQGFILNSGNSYHYYGIELLSEEGWYVFMETCQKYDNIGYEWPSFQLEDGFSVLRVSTSTAKPVLPQVIGKIGNFDF